MIYVRTNISQDIAFYSYLISFLIVHVIMKANTAFTKRKKPICHEKIPQDKRRPVYGGYQIEDDYPLQYCAFHKALTLYIVLCWKE